MMIHIYSKMGKLLCVDATKNIVLGPETLYIECDDCNLEYIRCGEPCCIVLHDNERGKQITLYDCTIKGKVIYYASRHIIGRSDK